MILLLLLLAFAVVVPCALLITLTMAWQRKRLAAFQQRYALVPASDLWMLEHVGDAIQPSFNFFNDSRHARVRRIDSTNIGQHRGRPIAMAQEIVDRSDSDINYGILAAPIGINVLFFTNGKDVVGTLPNGADAMLISACNSNVIRACWFERGLVVMRTRRIEEMDPALAVLDQLVVMLANRGEILPADMPNANDLR